jgi:putative hydrolase of the HAD superfamily
LTPCIVFDLDDTLYLERDYVRGGFSAVGVHAARTHGIHGLGETCWALFGEGVRGDTFDRALRLVGVAPDPGLVRELVAAYRGHTPDIALLEDARRCLEQARGSAFLGMVTDGPAVSQRAKIAALGTDTLIDHTIVTAELGEGFAKPDPRAFALIEAASGAGERTVSTSPTIPSRTSPARSRWAGEQCACGAAAGCTPPSPAVPTSTA